MPEREDYAAGRGTLEIGYPWITTGAIMALEMILDRKWSVLEIGMGGSTIFYGRRCGTVISLETNKDWFDRTRQKVNELNLHNCCSFLMGGTEEIVNYFKGNSDGSYDLVAVDPDPVVADRLTVAMAALPKIKPGGWLLLDNYLAGTFKDFQCPEGWRTFTYDDFDWSGNGTRLYRKPL